MPQECVVIEDSHSGIISGKTAGCITVAIPNQITRMQDLSCATVMIESFSVDNFLQLVLK